MMSDELKQNGQQAVTGKVAVLLGGTSAEREISLQSGTAILKALRNENIAADAVDTKDSGWLQNITENYAHTFIALHGLNGEDGTVQAALALQGISYTGSGVLASALAMDKIRSKQLWRGINLPTPAFTLVDDAGNWQAIIDELGTVIVKPVREGSSIGMTIARNAEELKHSYYEAKKYDQNVLVEKWIEGEEYTVAILGRKTLPAIRLETDNAFYDYEAKYISEDTRYHCPCGLQQEELDEMNAMAIQAFDSLGCSDWGRVDFMRNKKGGFLLLEVNTVPGMTSHSLVPMAAKAAGMSFDKLVLRIFNLSLRDQA
jgi:D-alanine-D-alanine ligase